MKLPSLQSILHDAWKTFARFPLVIFDACITVFISLLLVDYEGPAKSSVLFKILYAGLVGIPFLLALSLFIEKKKLKNVSAIAIQACGIVLLVLYGLTVPSLIQNAPAFHIMRLFLLLFAAHMLVAVIPFTRKNGVKGFWNFNQILLFRFIVAGFFTFVLFSGFSIALGSLQQLFKVHVPGRRYPELFILLIGIFNTWYFLAGVPENPEELDTESTYPKVLKIFAQYILSSVLLVYLVILYAYIAKILIAWKWPDGWVSGLILGFSCVGFLALLLLHPLREQKENLWIKKIWTWFFYIMIPLVILLPLAAERRISQYGFTEERYILCAIAVWLAIMVAYFILSKTKSIKIIPASLCLIALIITLGPLSAFNISEQSQVSILKNILLKDSVLVNGKIVKTHKEFPHADAEKAVSIISYLHEMHGYDKIQPWFNQPLQLDSAHYGVTFLTPGTICNILGLNVQNSRTGIHAGVNVFSSARDIVNIRGYDNIILNQWVNSAKTEVKLQNGNILCKFENDLTTMKLISGTNKKDKD